MPRLIPIALRLVVLLLFVLLLVGAFVLFAESLTIWLTKLGATLRQAFPRPESEVVRGLLAALAEGAHVVVPMAFAVALANHFLAEPTKLFQEFLKSLVEAMKLSSVYVVRGQRGRELVPAFVKPSVYVAVAWFLVGWYSELDAVPPPPPPVNAVYMVSGADPGQPFSAHLLVHFDNAAIDEQGELAERGVSLDDARTEDLRATVETLGRKCVTAERGVAIRPYGFASDDTFDGLPDESDQLNVAAANQRGRVVQEALVKIAEDVAGVTVEPAKVWKNLTQMARKRNSMIKFANENDRNAFADRVVILFVSDSGLCRIQQSAPAQPSGNTAASANG